MPGATIDYQFQGNYLEYRSKGAKIALCYGLARHFCHANGKLPLG